MKLDKIKFAQIVNWFSARSSCTIDYEDLRELDNIIDVNVPTPDVAYPASSDISQLMFLMQQGTQKIEAIKLHRKLTGWGLKESKEEVEKYWSQPKPFAYTHKDMMNKLKELPVQQLDEAIITNFINRFE